MAITSTYSIFSKKEGETLYSLTLTELNDPSKIYDVMSLNIPLLDTTIIPRGTTVRMPIYKDNDNTSSIQVIEAKDPW